MSDQTMSQEIDAAMAPVRRLSERLASLKPTPGSAPFVAGANPPLPRPSPTVAAALAKSQARAAKIASHSARRSWLGSIVGGFVSAASFVPYAVIALALRLVIARVFFLAGQEKVEGIRLISPLRELDFSVILPMQVKAETITAFMTQYSAVPLPPVAAATIVSAMEFILPIFLVLGFATRFSALALIAMTAVIQIYVAPEALWTTHIYWIGILALLLTRGPGALSIDHIIRKIARR